MKFNMQKNECMIKSIYSYPWFNGCFTIFIVFIIISHQEHKLIQNPNEKRPTQSKHVTWDHWRKINPAIFETAIVKWMDKFPRSAITKV